jgi:hypothetical protein
LTPCNSKTNLTSQYSFTVTREEFTLFKNRWQCSQYLVRISLKDNCNNYYMYMIVIMSFKLCRLLPAIMSDFLFFYFWYYRKHGIFGYTHFLSINKSIKLAFIIPEFFKRYRLLFRSRHAYHERRSTTV